MKYLLKKIIKNKGTSSTGTLFIIVLLLVVFSAAFMMIGGQLPSNQAKFPNGQQIIIITPTPGTAKNNLQLLTFYGITPTPEPTTTLTSPSLCQQGGVNNEPEILVGYLPASGQSVSAGGQIKVWVNDEGAPIIAPGEVLNPTTGQITTPGDRTAKADDGFLWEPALYISPQTAENGGTPHFPNYIKGDYNNNPTSGGGFGGGGSGSNIPGMDPPPSPSPSNNNGIFGGLLGENYTAEDIWDVTPLNLAPGTYTAEFVIHDGDRDRGIGCVTITIQ